MTRDRLAIVREAARAFRVGWWQHLATDADGDVGVINADVHQFAPDPVIASDLDAPEGFSFLTLTESYREWPKHQTLESVTDGYIATIPIEDVRLRTYQADDGQDLHLVVLRQRAWHKGGTGFGQLAWAGGGRLSTFSLHDFSPSIHRFSDLRHAWDAISTVAHIQITAPGPRAMSDEAAFEQAVTFGLEWLDRHPGKEPKDFGDQEFASARCTGMSAARTWMTTKHFGIKRVRIEMARRIGP